MTPQTTPRPSFDAPAAARLLRRHPGLVFWALHAGGWCGVFLVGYLSLLANDKPPGFTRVWLAVAVTGFVGTFLLRHLLRAWRDAPPLRLMLRMLVPMLLVGAAMGLTYALFARHGWCGGCQPLGGLGHLTYVGAQMYVVVGWTSLYLAITGWRRLRAQNESILAATAMAHQAQLKMLRYQLNPHFLFNTLNAISTLVLDHDNVRAERMVQRLGAFLRHSLDADPMERVTLRQELAAIDLYLDIERTRFGERLQVRIAVQADCWPALLPSLLLQPLVENAIRHAIAGRAEGGTLRIGAACADRRLHLVVADDGPGWPALAGMDGALPDGTGIGLANIRDRLRMLYGERQRFDVRNGEGGGLEVRIELPFECDAGAQR